MLRCRTVLDIFAPTTHPKPLMFPGRAVASGDPHPKIIELEKRMKRMDNYQAYREFHHMSVFKELIVRRAEFDKIDGNMKENISPLPSISEVQLDSNLLEFYQYAETWYMRWRAKGDVSLDGRFHVLPLTTVLLGDVDFLPEEYPVMKNFTLLDHFYNEAAVGFYLDQPEKGLHYFEFDADPRPLFLNFAGYMEMLKLTRGFQYWQLSILSLAEGHELGREDVLKTVSTIFPDFTAKRLIDLYRSLRIDK